MKGFSSLPRARMVVKDFKIEVGISLWDLQAGWDSDMYTGVEKAFQMARRRTHSTAGVRVCQMKSNPVFKSDR